MPTLGGLLGDISSWAKQTYANGEPYRATLGGLLYGDTKPLMGLLNQPVKMNPMTVDEATAMALDWAPMGIGAIKAFHGSPHKFDKFDMSKIGSGEGAQAYGHGLYFAESPEVAGMYAKGLQAPKINKPSSKMSPLEMALDDINYFNGNEQAALSAWKSAAKNPNTAAGEMAKKKLDLWESGEVGNKLSSQMYEVSLRHPDPVKEASTPLSPSDFLHYGEPVPEALRQSVSKSMLDKFGSGASMGTGEQLYRQIVDEFKFAKHPDPNNAAIKWMSEQGIPGIRYLDGGSRDAGQGTFNYVVFDDRIPKIVNRNGK
jgi:hypothetical protein